MSNYRKPLFDETESRCTMRPKTVVRYDRKVLFDVIEKRCSMRSKSVVRCDQKVLFDVIEKTEITKLIIKQVATLKPNRFLKPVRFSMRVTCPRWLADSPSFPNEGAMVKCF
jgi:hypothetical protein